MAAATNAVLHADDHIVAFALDQALVTTARRVIDRAGSSAQIIALPLNSKRVA